LLVLGAATANRFAGARCRPSRPTIDESDLVRHQSKGDAMWMKEEDEDFDDDDLDDDDDDEDDDDDDDEDDDEEWNADE
jgi:hypothetical protein